MLAQLYRGGGGGGSPRFWSEPSSNPCSLQTGETQTDLLSHRD